MASSPITSWQIDGETVDTVADFIFLGSKITSDGDYSHEIKRCLLLERKVLTNLDSILKSRDITLPTKVRLVKAMVFPVIMYVWCMYGSCIMIPWLQSPSTVILEPKKIKSDTAFSLSPSISHEVMGPHAMILVFWMLNFNPTFSLSSFHFHQEAFQVLFTLCHKGGGICISEVVDISPSNLDSNLCFIQPSISHDVLCI